MKKLITLSISIFLLLAACTNMDELQENSNIDEAAESQEMKDLTESSNYQVYANQQYGFSIEIPDGPYSVSDDSSSTGRYIVISNDDLSFAEFTLTIEDGSLETYDRNPNAQILEEEDVVSHDVPGKLFLYGYFRPGESEPLEGAYCPVYVLDDEKGHIFTFRLWECLESPIFEEVVRSFKLVST